MKRSVKIGVAGMRTALLAVGGAGAYNIVHRSTGGSSDSGGSRPLAAGAPDTPPSDGDGAALDRARAFLAARSGRHAGAAARNTDMPSAAEPALRGYAKGLGLKTVSFGNIAAAGPSTVTPGATKVTFDVTAQVAGRTWHYPGAVAVRKSARGALAVH